MTKSADPIVEGLRRLQAHTPAGTPGPVAHAQRDDRKEDANMADLTDLERKLKEKLALSEERQQLQQNHLRQQMVEAEVRHQRYTGLADRLLQEVIRPRMEKLKTLFDNARLPEARNSRHTCCCQFEHTPRFPATARLELGVTRDGEIKTVTLQYAAEILPVFFPVEGRDELTMPLDELDEGKAAAWVEAKIVQFVDSYLRLETSNHHQEGNLVTDPVCGMRVNKAFAPAQMTYRGRTYYFCIPECQARFAEDPERYLAG
jgi:YHS domain-containing protein